MSRTGSTASPPATLASTKTTSPIRNMRARPNRSASLPPSRRNPPNETAYPLISHCKADGPPGTVDLDVTTNARFLEPIEIAVHYVASEALANAMKHAQASRIEISLTTRRDSLLLSIRDDGIGGPMPRAGADLTDDPPDQAP